MMHAHFLKVNGYTIDEINSRSPPILIFKSYFPVSQTTDISN